ncbi:hypothetical protein BJY52DRAFT_1221670 [Lactarius psammicola]|nr:hypothetical protein BJY52DRAFT_1221670 [Lactarius psammicola]
MATPTPAPPHAGTLPARTPAPPGGRFSTPGPLRRKSLMKVRFETTPSDSAVSDADVTAEDDKRVEDSLPEANWNIIPPPGLDQGASDRPLLRQRYTSGDGQKEDDDPVGSLSRYKLRRTASVRLVDEYRRALEDLPSTPSRKDVRKHSASMHMPGGGPLKAPRNTSVRILDAMGHELEEPSKHNDERMKRAVADLREGFNNVDTSGNGSLDDPRLGELYDLSKAAQDMRSKIASSLQQAQTAQIRHRYGPLTESMRKSRFLPNFLPESCNILGPLVILGYLFASIHRLLGYVPVSQLDCISKIYARHQFLTTYFDPFYANLHLHPTKPEFIYDTNPIFISPSGPNRSISARTFGYR